MIRNFTALPTTPTVKLLLTLPLKDERPAVRVRRRLRRRRRPRARGGEVAFLPVTVEKVVLSAQLRPPQPQGRGSLAHDGLRLDSLRKMTIDQVIQFYRTEDAFIVFTGPLVGGRCAIV